MPRRTAISLAAALLCAGMAAAIWAVALHTGPGRQADLRAYLPLNRRFYVRPGLEAPLESYAYLFNPAPYLLWASLLVAAAYKLRGLRTMTVVAGVLLGSNMLTQYFKTALATDRGTNAVSNIEFAAWPSGHATATLVLACCAVMIAPAAWRVGVAIAGAVLVLSIGVSIVGLGWHYPSDVLGGWAISGMFVALGVACLPARASAAVSRPAATAALDPRWRRARG